METKKLYLILALGLVIIITGFLIYMNRDTLFMSEVRIRYGNGCEEIYRNKQLVGLPCPEVERPGKHKINTSIPDYLK